MSNVSKEAPTPETAGSSRAAAGNKTAIKAPSRRKIQTFKADGVKVTLIRHERRACVRFKTTYDMDQKARCDAAVMLAAYALRPRTRPQVGRRQGFCDTIRPKHAVEAAQRVLSRLRRDKKFAAVERLREPPCYVRSSTEELSRTQEF